MKEYVIYERLGSGTPYMIHFFDNVDSAKLKLYEMIALEEERHRSYFVDNDFFHNKYVMVGKLKYYTIKVREVTDWQQYTEDNIEKINNDKIIFFGNYKKSLTK